MDVFTSTFLVCLYISFLAVVFAVSLYLWAKRKDAKEKRLSNLFDISHQEFVNLNKKERDEILNKADELNWPFVEKYFKGQPDVKWIVIAKYAGNVIVSGGGDSPEEYELVELSRRENRPVFTYTRWAMVEERK